MRVLLVNHTSTLGGAEYSLLELARALPAAAPKISLVVAAPRGALLESLAELGLEHHELPLNNPLKPRGARAAARASLELGANICRTARLLRRLRPDVVHANSAKAALAVIPAARALGIRCSWQCRDIAPVGARQLVGLAQHTVAISQTVLDSLPPSPRISLIHNGIDLSRFDPERHDRDAARAGLGLTSAQRLILMVADLIPWKRHALFIEAAASIKRRLPNTVFAIAGSDRGEHPDLEQELRRQAECLGLGHALRWLRHCPDTATLYAAADLLIHPPEREPFGRVVCEALAMNCPVVVADAGGAAEISRGCAVARQAAAGDAEAFATLAEATLAQCGSPSAGRDHVSKYFDARRTARELAEMLARRS